MVTLSAVITLSSLTVGLLSTRIKNSLLLKTAAIAWALALYGVAVTILYPSVVLGGIVVIVLVLAILLAGFHVIYAVVNNVEPTPLGRRK